MAKSRLDIIASNTAQVVSEAVDCLRLLVEDARFGGRNFKAAWEGQPLATHDAVLAARRGAHTACFLAIGMFQVDTITRVSIHPRVVEAGEFISLIQKRDQAGVLKHLGLPEDAELSPNWADEPEILFAEATEEFAPLAYVFEDPVRLDWFFEDFNSAIMGADARKELPFSYTTLTVEDYQKWVDEEPKRLEEFYKREEEIKKLQEQADAKKAEEEKLAALREHVDVRIAAAEQAQSQGKEKTMTEQANAQPQAAAEQTANQGELAKMAAEVDKNLELAKAAGKTEAVECLTFLKKVASECAGIADPVVIDKVTTALLDAEAAKLQALGKAVPAWLATLQALAQAKLDGRVEDAAIQEAAFEALLAKLVAGTNEGAEERFRPILAERVKAQLPKGEPTPAFLDRDIQQGEEVIEQQAVKAAQAAKAAGLSESSAIAAHRIVLTEDRAKLREAISELPVYNPTGNEMVAHNTEVVRNFYISSGGGGSSRASEPLFSDEFVETCGNIAKVALGTAVVVGVGYVAFKGAQALYDWATD